MAQEITRRRLPKDCEWEMADAIFRRIFPDLGEGPFSTVGLRTSPSDWRRMIRDGLEDAFEILLRGEVGE